MAFWAKGSRGQGTSKNNIKGPEEGHFQEQRPAWLEQREPGVTARDKVRADRQPDHTDHLALEF